MEENLAIEIKNLSKVYKNNKNKADVLAVNNISLRVPKGKMIGFLGLNGAGKSTTINIISGQSDKSSGKVYVENLDLDKDVTAIKSKLGMVYQYSVLDNDLLVKDNLKLRAGLYKLNKNEIEEIISDLVNKFELQSILKRPYGKLSGGQQRRVDIARALISKPKILILDEPTTGLDPVSRKLVWSVINDLRIKESLTIFLTTHYMEEANDCDYIYIIDNGVIKEEGTPIELKNKYGKVVLKIEILDEWKDKIIETFKANKINYEFDKMNLLTVYFDNFKNAQFFIENNKKIYKSYELIKGNMDQVFLNVTGKKVGEL